MSKFKVGSKVVPSNGDCWDNETRYRVVVKVVGGGAYNLSLYEELDEVSYYQWNDEELSPYKEDVAKESKFKVGDRVAKVDGTKWNMTNGAKLDYRTVRDVTPSYKYKLSKTEDSMEYSEVCWRREEIKLYKEAKEDKPRKVVELTYVELINYLMKEGKDGEKWIPKKLDSRSTGIVEYITFSNSAITVKHRRGVQVVNINIDSASTFVREEVKILYRVYQVEHQESGKRYDFGRNYLSYVRPLDIQDMVVCDTKYGHTYGKIVAYKDIEMTEAEYDEYSKIIKKV